MKRLRNSASRFARCCGRLRFPAALPLGLLLLAAHTQFAFADITNSAVARASYGGGDVFSAPDTAAVPVAPENATLSVTKTADDTTDVAVGQTITYTYVIKNTGNLTLSEVTPTDSHNASGSAPVPAGETLTDAGTTGDSTDASNNGVWDVLAPGDTVTFTGTHIVTQSDVDTLQ